MASKSKPKSLKSQEPSGPPQPVKEATPPPTIEIPKETKLGSIRTFWFGKDGPLWSTFEIEIEGDKVLSITKSNADTKFIAFEQFKLNVVKNFLEKDV